MGSTAIPLWQFGSMKEFVKEFTWENENVKRTLLDYAVINRTELYGALEILNKNTNERIVVALIGKFTFTKEDCTYKIMDETEGPYYYNCPERILNLLTPTANEFANNWRELCRERKQRSNFTMKEGLILAYKDPSTSKVTTVTLLYPLRKSKGGSWAGRYSEDNRIYRWSKQRLIKDGYATIEHNF